MLFRSHSALDPAGSGGSLRSAFGKMAQPMVEKHYNFRGGELYYSPMLIERFISFRDEFKIPMEHRTVDEIERFEERVQLGQYDAAKRMEECATCPYLAACVDRGVLLLMQSHGEVACIVPRRVMAAAHASL